MKKFLALILSLNLAFTPVLLTGCGGSQNTASDYDPSDKFSTDTSPAAVTEAVSEQAETEVYQGSSETDKTKKSALDTAVNYLEYTSYSYSGLIDQLVYEGFSEEEATKAVDSLNVDWNEQAEKSAQSYINYLGLSYNGLKSQLEFEGFTEEQAQKAVDGLDVDWKEQAVRSAQTYLENMDFTKDELINQLEYEGFTHEEAVYGVDHSGGNFN